MAAAWPTATKAMSTNGWQRAAPTATKHAPSSSGPSAAATPATSPSPHAPSKTCVRTSSTPTNARTWPADLLHDTTLNTVDRVAGLLLLLHAQSLSRIARLTLDRVTQRVTDRTVELHLGRTPLELPTPLDQLVLDLVDRRHGSAVVGRTHDLTWLLPGGAPGHPISARQLMRRLQKLGIRARHVRNTTLMDLAAQLPASVLADLLGLRPPPHAGPNSQATPRPPTPPRSFVGRLDHLEPSSRIKGCRQGHPVGPPAWPNEDWERSH